MALQGLVDWRGGPVNQKKHGGVKASMFIHFLIVMANIANIPMILNLVSYLHGTMHMGVKDASTTSTNFFGAICFFSFLGAFVSDSYLKRFYTMLIFAPIEIMGYTLLAFQAHLPSLHPPPCDMINHPSECTPVSGRNLSLLTLGLYLIPIGEGSLRSCAAALGGDQFDGDDPAELHGKISFFNWFAFCISLGGFVGLVFLVWVQDNEGWGLSFALSALLVLVGTVVVGAGLPFYRHQKPMGSPLTRIFQVFVAAFRKRKLSLPENQMEMHEVTADSTGTSVKSMERTSDFKFLDKAAVDDGDTRGWSLCTVTQVEEAKIILRMAPIFLSSVLGNVSIPLLLSLTVQQGGTMDTRLGGTSIPPASLFIVPIVFQIIILVIYDRAIMPWLRRATGNAGGVTHLQRVGVGFASSVLALAVAAVVERRRRGMGAAEMSVFWLTPQFFLLGVMDVTSFVGLLEFFYSEASAGMKSIGGAIVFCVLGAASWLGSLLIQVVNHATASRGGGHGHGWLDGANLNASRLDLFYWLLAVFALVSFFLYLLCAWRYTYRHDPRLQAGTDDGNVAPAATKKATV
ncbi:unnamed protein product [Urochloa decumbens]|uniref:Uncharacterized protein n=1 Tax=Urochloa decumbens TaxID=240449 RepID=A0ABC8VTR1_9POAL